MKRELFLSICFLLFTIFGTAQLGDEATILTLDQNGQLSIQSNPNQSGDDYFQIHTVRVENEKFLSIRNLNQEGFYFNLDGLEGSAEGNQFPLIALPQVDAISVFATGAGTDRLDFYDEFDVFDLENIDISVSGLEEVYFLGNINLLSADIDIDASGFVYVSNQLTTSTGSISITGNIDGDSSGNFSGVYLVDAEVTSGSGNVTISGVSGTMEADNHGVWISEQSTVESTGFAGTVSISGTVNLNNGIAGNYGVLIEESSSVASSSNNLGLGELIITGEASNGDLQDAIHI
ncbi:MAG: hypothetical protein AAF193_06185, partial [Bacteroidota bacterium]